LDAGGVLLLGIALAEAAGLRVNATASMSRGIWLPEPESRAAKSSASVCLTSLRSGKRPDAATFPRVVVLAVMNRCSSLSRRSPETRSRSPRTLSL
jgi:hypothetical protein